MFRGSLPSDVQAILCSAASSWGGRDIYVGCSGNFTVERALASRGDYILHGNDVTIYSSIAGAFLAGDKARLEIKDARFDWLAPYIESGEGKAATIFLASRLVDGMTSTGEVKNNAYYERMTKAYRAQFPSLHEKTCQKIVNLKMRLQSYFNGDVMEFVDMVPQDAAFIVYPPFYAGDYTNMFKKLNLIFDWDAPEFGELDDAALVTLYEKVTSKSRWLFGTDTPQEQYSDFLIGLARTTNRGVPMYLYSNSGDKKIVQPMQKTETVMNARLDAGMNIGERLTISKLTYQQFQALRSQYMNAFIRPGQASEAYAALVDGYMIGVFAISASPNPAQAYFPDHIYLLSDFPVAPTSYPKLSKLVLYAALSKEAVRMFERVARKRIRYLYTTAFSNNYESMKYRGLFKLHNRTEAGPSATDPYQKKFKINYEAEAGKWTLADGLKLWKQKHGETSQHADQSYQD